MLLLFQTASSLLHVASPSVTPPTSHSSLPAHCVVRERAISVSPPHLLSSSRQKKKRIQLRYIFRLGATALVFDFNWF